MKDMDAISKFLFGDCLDKIRDLDKKGYTKEQIEEILMKDLNERL